MNEQLLYLRKEYGDVFVTDLPDGYVVPWRPLTVGEYLQYNKIHRIKQYSSAYIENEIFRKCVLDKVLVRSIDKLKAGVVSSVATSILDYSGPKTVDELNYMLDLSRIEINDALHDMVGFICQAFPAYKPEEVYAMDYQTFMLRAAQSERKMLGTGFIKEPLKFEDKNTSEQQGNKEEHQKHLEKSKKFLNNYLEQQGFTTSSDTQKEQPQVKEKITEYPTPVSVPPPTQERTIITKSDMMEHAAILSGHERDIVYQTRSTDATAEIYKEYLDQMKDGGELRIKTPEERKAAALARMEENKQKIAKRVQKVREEAKKELPELLKVREDARRRKARKAARRRK